VDREVKQHRGQAGGQAQQDGDHHRAHAGWEALDKLGGEIRRHAGRFRFGRWNSMNNLPDENIAKPA
jgi:hypothetical protein